MRIYFDSLNLSDALLRDLVTDEIITESSKQLEQFALNNNVDPSRIATPTPYIVSNLAEAYAYRKVALNQMGINGVDSSGSDSYSAKYAVYNKLVAKYELEITPATLLGGKSHKRRSFPLSARLNRR